MSIRDRMKQDMVAPGGRTKGGPRGVYVSADALYGQPDLQSWLISRVATSPVGTVWQDPASHRYVFVPLDRRDKLVLQALRAGDLEAARRWISSWPRRICEHCNGELVGTERREPYLDGCDDTVRIKRTGHYDWWHARSGQCEAVLVGMDYASPELRPYLVRHEATPSAHERDPLVSA